MKCIFQCFAIESGASTTIQYLILNSLGMLRRGSQSHKENYIMNGKMQGLACDCQELFLERATIAFSADFICFKFLSTATRSFHDLSLISHYCLVKTYPGTSLVLHG